MSGVLIEQPYEDTETLGECPVKMEVEIRVMRLQVKECQRMLAVTRNWERGMEKVLSQSSQMEPTLLTPRFQTFSLQN